MIGNDEDRLEGMSDHDSADELVDALIDNYAAHLSEEHEKAMRDLTAALDEIYLLRQAMAYEAAVLQEHTRFASFPKSRRVWATQQIERMRKAAESGGRAAYADVNPGSLSIEARNCGLTTLTRAQFVKERE
jgi:hypothetical protein